MTTTPPVKPLFRWVGSKRRFAKQIAEHLPARITSYFEPFAGSGAVFLELHNQGRLAPGSEVYLDEQGPVLDLWNALLLDPEGLTEEVICLACAPASMSVVYEQAKVQLTDVDVISRAAAFLYLNRTAFNGLYRVSAKSGFNVPRDPNAASPKDLGPRIRELAEVLDLYQVFTGDAEEAWRHAEVIYIDPPYHDVWTGYTAQKFSELQQAAVALHAIRAQERGAHVLASNSDTPLVRGMYSAHFDLVELSRTNVVSCKASTRKEAKAELLMIPPAQTTKVFTA